MVQVGDVIVSFDVLTEKFCCDLSVCHGECCVEGDAGAPVLLDEVSLLETAVPVVKDDLSPEALAEIDRQGVVYSDPSGELVTSIVNGKDCVFCMKGDLQLAEGAAPTPCTLCAIEKAWREGRSSFMKPVSCHLYPIRVGHYGSYYTLNYHKWDICQCAVKKGKEENIAVYQFLREPLIRKFGQEWYDELCFVADELKRQQVI